MDNNTTIQFQAAITKTKVDNNTTIQFQAAITKPKWTTTLQSSVWSLYHCQSGQQHYNPVSGRYIIAKVVNNTTIQCLATISLPKWSTTLQSSVWPLYHCQRGQHHYNPRAGCNIKARFDTNITIQIDNTITNHAVSCCNNKTKVDNNTTTNVWPLFHCQSGQHHYNLTAGCNIKATEDNTCTNLQSSFWLQYLKAKADNIIIQYLAALSRPK